MKNLLTIAVVLVLGITTATAQPCQYPLENNAFARGLRDLSQDNWNLLRNARDFSRNNCLSSAQAYQVTLLFRNDPDRLDYAYYAYNYVIDPLNYTIVADAFINQRDHDELLGFINQRNTPRTPPVVVVPPPVYVDPPVVIEYVPGYHGRVNCMAPMNNSDYENARGAIQSKSFDDTKMTIAQEILNANCATVAQLKGFIRTFSFESNKLAFAKYAYDHVYDVDNYYQLSSEFTFESNSNDLSAYVGSHPLPNAVVLNSVPVREHHDHHGDRDHDHDRDRDRDHGRHTEAGGYTNNPNNGRCFPPVTTQEWDEIIRPIQRKSFDKGKVELAKQIVTVKCLTAAQVRDICKLMSFDDSRLDFAKFAYTYCYDPQNYYLVADGLTFEMYKKQLAEYVTHK